MAEPCFSVIIPLYNCRDYIGDTIQSVLNQSFQSFEIVVVDDDSTDNSAEVVKTFNDPRIKLIRQAHCGVSAARNTGIENARGEFIAFLDADDYWHKQHLAAAHEAFKQYDVNWYASTYCRTAERYSAEKLQDIPEKSNTFALYDFYRNGFDFVCASSVAMRRAAIKNLRFKVNMHLGEDQLFWYSFAAENPRIAVSGRAMAFYYRRSDSATGNMQGDAVARIENICNLLIGQKTPDKNNYFFIFKFYVLFYRNINFAGKKAALDALTAYSKYLRWDIIMVFKTAAYFSLIFKSKAAIAAHFYLRLCKAVAGMLH